MICGYCKKNENDRPNRTYCTACKNLRAAQNRGDRTSSKHKRHNYPRLGEKNDSSRNLQESS